MPRIREPIAERLGRPHTPKAGLQAGSVCDKKKVPAQLELRGRESLEQRTSPLMNHDITRAPSRKVEPDLSRYANARIPIQQDEALHSLEWHPSKIGHEKPGPNPRGPSRKAKYSMTTDSEPSRAIERWEEPRKGRTLNLKPHAYKRWEGIYA